MKLFARDRIALGKGHVTAYTLIEIKRLFSVIVYHFETVAQDRFHTHGFAALAFLLSGSYEEEVFDGSRACRRTVDQWLRPRFLPQRYCHRILAAQPQTWTLVLAGPWGPTWTEFWADTGKFQVLTWGRRVVERGVCAMYRRADPTSTEAFIVGVQDKITAAFEHHRNFRTVYDVERQDGHVTITTREVPR